MKLATGELYAAKLFKLDKIPTHSEQAYAKWIADVVQEVNVVKTLQTPYIAQLHDYNFTNGAIERKLENKKVIFDAKYIIYEYVENGDLIEYIMPPLNKLPENVCKRIFYEMLIILKYFETQNLAHRDLKLENIAVGKDFHLKILDFGFSKITKSLLTTYIGTEAYMPPEIIEYKNSKDCPPYNGQKADIFSLGVIIFCMYLGTPPFKVALKRDPRYKQFVENKLVFWNIISHASKCPINENFADLICKILASDPLNRPTIEQMLAHPWIKDNIATEEQYQCEFRERRKRVRLPFESSIGKLSIGAVPMGIYKGIELKDKIKSLYRYMKGYDKVTSLYSSLCPNIILRVLYDAIKKLPIPQIAIDDSSSKCKLTVNANEFMFKVKLYKVSDDITYIELMLCKVIRL